MDPQIALQLVTTLAKIHGTLLAIYLAVTIFALRDEILAQLILLPKRVHSLQTLNVIFLSTNLTINIIVLSSMNLETPFSDDLAKFLVGSFVGSLITLILDFWIFTSLKRRFLEQKHRKRE